MEVLLCCPDRLQVFASAMVALVDLCWEKDRRNAILPIFLVLLAAFDTLGSILRDWLFGLQFGDTVSVVPLLPHHPIPEGDAWSLDVYAVGSCRIPSQLPCFFLNLREAAE